MTDQQRFLFPTDDDDDADADSDRIDATSETPKIEFGEPPPARPDNSKDATGEMAGPQKPVFSTCGKIPASESDDLIYRVNEKIEASEERARAALAAICDQLANQGIDQLRIEYDGYGDTGIVGDVIAFAGQKKVELEDHVTENLREAVYDVLPCGWELNAGSYGELIVDVGNRKVTSAQNWRIEDEIYEEDTFAI